MENQYFPKGVACVKLIEDGSVINSRSSLKLKNADILLTDDALVVRYNAVTSEGKYVEREETIPLHMVAVIEGDPGTSPWSDEFEAARKKHEAAMAKRKPLPTAPVAKPQEFKAPVKA